MPEATDKNLNKIKKLLAIVDEDTLTRSEFVDSFSKVVDLVLKIQKKQEDAINQLKMTYENLLKHVAQKHDMSLQELKGQVDHVFVGDRVKKIEEDYGSRSKSMDEKMGGMKSMHEEMMADMDKKMEKMESMHEEMMGMMKDKMAKVKDGKPPTKQEVEATLKPLVEEATKNLKKEFNEKISRIPKGKMGMRKVPIFQATDFTSSVDGATTTFTLPRDTVRVFGVFSTQFPGVFNTSDWSFTGNTLTLNFTLQSGQSLIVFHENLFYS